MTCDVGRDKLDSYVDSELTADELAAFESHLRDCASCAADALSRLQMKRMTQAAGVRYVPSPEFRVRLERSIVPKKRRSFWSFGFIPKLAMAAAAVVLLVASAGLWMRHSAREQALTELADLHVAALASANPVDVVSTDRHTVKPWFAGKLPFTFNLPELQNTPFALVGGKIAYFEHSPGAQLLFTVRKHHLSVFIFQETSAGAPFRAGMSHESKLAFNMESWSEGGLRYVVISDATASDVRELSGLLKQAARS